MALFIVPMETAASHHRLGGALRGAASGRGAGSTRNAPPRPHNVTEGLELLPGSASLGGRANWLILPSVPLVAQTPDHRGQVVLNEGCPLAPHSGLD